MNLPEGQSVTASADVPDAGPMLRDDFVRLLEASYQDKDIEELFRSTRVPVLVSYSHISGQRFRTECEIEFHQFNKTASTTFRRRVPIG